MFLPGVSPCLDSIQTFPPETHQIYGRSRWEWITRQTNLWMRETEDKIKHLRVSFPSLFSGIIDGGVLLCIVFMSTSFTVMIPSLQAIVYVWIDCGEVCCDFVCDSASFLAHLVQSWWAVNVFCPEAVGTVCILLREKMMQWMRNAMTISPIVWVCKNPES